MSVRKIKFLDAGTFLWFNQSILLGELEILSNNFGSLIGYTSGTYPPSVQSTTYNTTGNTTPNISPVNSLILVSNIVNNPVTSPTNVLDTLAITNTFGSNINYSPPYEKWVPCVQGSYSNFEIDLLDQNFDTIQANDSNILISLLLRQPKLITNSLMQTPRLSTIDEGKDENDGFEPFMFSQY